jgi:CDP-4-dehydro-6-deoxyglucose reductase
MYHSDIFSITLSGKNKSFECGESDSILKGGLRHGLSIRHGCSNGTCGICKARLISGDIEKIKHYDYALSAKELDDNIFLMCCQSPRSNIELELDLIGDVRSIDIQEIQVKITDINFINDTMAIVSVRTPRSKLLQFMAGQDVELSFKKITSRYPIASCPCYSMYLEFHIRKSAKDNFSQAIFSKAIKVKTKIDLIGPKGVFVLKENSTKPMVFIALEAGFAPIRSLIEHAFSLEMSNPVYFYWGYPAKNKLPYLDNQAQSYKAVTDEYHYRAIACDFYRSKQNDCNKIAKQIYADLNLDVINQSEVYISAPAEVLIYLSELLLKNGLNEAQLIASPV